MNLVQPQTQRMKSTICDGADDGGLGARCVDDAICSAAKKAYCCKRKII